MWCWYVKLVYDVHIGELDVMVYDVDIWCSKINIFTTVYDVHMWCSYMIIKYQHFTAVCDVHMWFGWFPHVMLVYEVRYMMFVCEVGMWSWYVIFIFDVHMWTFLCWYMMFIYDVHIWFSSLIICRSVYDHIRTLFENFQFPKIPYMMFTCEHYRIWCSHVNTFSDEMNRRNLAIVLVYS